MAHVESLCLLLDELTHVQVVQGASGLDMNPEFMGFRFRVYRV